MAIDPRMNRAPVTPTFESASVAGWKTGVTTQAIFERAVPEAGAPALRQTKQKTNHEPQQNNSTETHMLSNKIIQRTSVDIEGVYSWAWRILIDSADNVWVSGAVHRPDNFPRWTLVRNSPGQQWQDSADGSDSWSHRTLLPTNPGYKSKGRGMTLDPAGNLFLTGDAIDSSIPINTYVGLLRLT